MLAQSHTEHAKAYGREARFFCLRIFVHVRNGYCPHLYQLLRFHPWHRCKKVDTLDTRDVH